MESTLLNFSNQKGSYLGLKWIRDQGFLIPMGKTILKDLMLYLLWLNNFMHQVADLQNGEQSLKSKKDALLNNLFMRMLGGWQDMQLFVNRTVLFLLSNLKFYQMAIIQHNTAKRLLKEFQSQFSKLFIKIMSYLKDVFLNPTWSLMVPNMQKRNKIIPLKKHIEQLELFQELSLLHQLESQYLFF